MTEDGRYLVITDRQGDRRRSTALRVKDLAEPYGMPVELIDNFDNEFTFVGNDGPVFCFKTDLDAPRKRVIAIDLAPAGQGALARDHPAGRRDAARGQLRGQPAHCPVPEGRQDAGADLRHRRPVRARGRSCPAIGTASGFGGQRTDTETFYSFSSFATPPSIYRYDMVTGTEHGSSAGPKVKFNPDDYEVKQVFYHSKDGTRVPMFLVHKKGIKLDGSNPTLLYGYGGFNISLHAEFSPSAGWRGWRWAACSPCANLRGGGEYGEAWHEAGTKLEQAERVRRLHRRGRVAHRRTSYTRPEKLAIQGGSNGGLLVGAVMTQRPDLFGACLPAVGVMDMLRFQKFTAGRFWVDDYGSSDDPERVQGPVGLFAATTTSSRAPATRPR